MIDIHEYLAEATLTAEKLYPTDLLNVIDDVCKFISDNVKLNNHSKVTAKMQVDIAKVKNDKKTLLVYVKEDDVNCVSDRMTLTENLHIALEANLTAVSNGKLTKLASASMHNISRNVKVLTCEYAVDEEDTNFPPKVKVIFAVKPANRGINDLGVKYSDITEVTPVVLFKYCKRQPCLATAINDDFCKALQETLDSIKDDPNECENYLPNNWHLDRYQTLYCNLAYDSLGKAKVQAGINLYNYIMNTFNQNNEIVNMSVIANKIGYDTVADILVDKGHNDTVKISVKSYQSVTTNVKLKSVAVYRLLDLDTRLAADPALKAKLVDKDTKCYTKTYLPKLLAQEGITHAIMSSRVSLIDLSMNALITDLRKRKCQEKFIGCVVGDADRVLNTVSSVKNSKNSAVLDISAKELSELPFSVSRTSNYAASPVAITIGQYKFYVAIRNDKSSLTYDIYYKPVVNTNKDQK